MILENINGLHFLILWIIFFIVYYIIQKNKKTTSQIDRWRQTALDTNKLCNDLINKNKLLENNSRQWETMYRELLEKNKSRR